MKVDKLPTTRLSRKTGRIDGREGLPDLRTEKPHSPFLGELTAVGGQHFAATSDSLNLSLLKFSAENDSLSAQRIKLNQSKEDIAGDITGIEKLCTLLDDEYIGSENQSQASKITDRRFLPSWLYFLILLISIIGEVAITYPAFEEVFGDHPLIAIISTAAASAMSIGYAFILGLTLKRHDDKKRLLQRWVLPTVLGCSVFIIGLATTLSHLRAKKFDEPLFTSEAPVTEALPESLPEALPESLPGDLIEVAPPVIPKTDDGVSTLVPGTVEDTPLFGDSLPTGGILEYEWALALFLSLQLSLILIAALGEYFHYSYIADEQKRIKKMLNKLRKTQGKIINQIGQITATLNSISEREKQIRLKHSAIITRIKKKVESRFHAYWGMNIRQRADSPDAKSRKFEPPTLDNPDWFISE